MLNVHSQSVNNSDSDEIKTDGCGVRYIDGKNGKRWKLAVGVPYHDRELAEGMSAIYWGWPQLNELEQRIFDAVFPLLHDEADSIESDHQQLMDTVCRHLPDDEWWLRNETPEFDPFALAYRIAESVVEDLARSDSPQAHTGQGVGRSTPHRPINGPNGEGPTGVLSPDGHYPPSDPPNPVPTLPRAPQEAQK